MPSTRPGEQGSRAVETGTLVICLVSTLVLGGATLPLMKHLGLHDPSDREGMVSSAMSATAHDGLGFINPSPRARAVRARALADGHPIRYLSIAFRVKARLFEWWDDLENNFMIPTFGGAPAHGAWSPVNTSDAGGSADAHETTPANGEEYRDVELTPIGDDDEKDLENLRAAGPSSDDA